MKNTFKAMVTGIIIGTMATGGVSVLANNGTINIPATFKNIRIFVDGAELTQRDSYGNVLEPFIYNGSTYLPVRAVAEAVGKNVSYDANTNTVYLGSAGAKQSSTGTFIEPYQLHDARVDTAEMGGVSYRNSLCLGPLNGGYALFNLGGNYTSLSGMVGILDGGGKGDSSKIYIYGDGVLLKEYECTGGDLPKNLSVNVTGVSQLTIETEEGYYPEIGIGSYLFK